MPGDMIRYAGVYSKDRQLVISAESINRIDLAQTQAYHGSGSTGKESLEYIK